MKYYSRVSIRDGEKTIGACLSSLINQTVKPEKIIVVNDGSTDRTSEIINEYKARHPELIEVVDTGSKTRDYSRLPHLLNISISHAKPLNCDYFFSTGGDCSFAPDYAEKIINAMEQDPLLVIASGDYCTMQTSAPHGSGRIIRLSWFNANYPRGYPEIIGYESEILERAIMRGCKIAVLPDARFYHLEKLGHAHGFKEWGFGMRALGYDPLYTLVLCWNFAFHNRQVGLKATIKILYNYSTYRPAKQGYLSKFDNEIRHAIGGRQRKYIIDGAKNLPYRIKRRVIKAIFYRTRCK